MNYNLFESGGIWISIFVINIESRMIKATLLFIVVCYKMLPLFPFTVHIPVSRLIPLLRFYCL